MTKSRPELGVEGIVSEITPESIQEAQQRVDHEPPPPAEIKRKAFHRSQEREMGRVARMMAER